MRKLILFDFDGTLYKGDSMLDFFGYLKRKPSMFSLISNGLKIRMSSEPNASRFKSEFLSEVFSPFDENTLKEEALNFQKKILLKQLKPQAKTLLDDHHNSGDKVVIASASLELWLSELAKDLKVELIATKCSFESGRFNGISGLNCKGAEKSRRILRQHKLEEYDEIHAYGDSKADKPMLSLATHPHYKAF